MIVDYEVGKLILKPENEVDTFDLGIISNKITCYINIERNPQKQLFKHISIRIIDLYKYLRDH